MWLLKIFSPNVNNDWSFFLFLQTATIQSYRNQDYCKYTNNAYDCKTNNVVIDDSVLCAGSTTQKIGVCFGDSGGPLIYFNGTHDLLMGVTSYVVGSCGSLGVVDGFARVTHQMDWIREHNMGQIQKSMGPFEKMPLL